MFLSKSLCCALFFVVLSISTATALECFTCFTPDACHPDKSPTIKTCDKSAVMATSKEFSFLPRALSQPETTQFHCAAYEATFLNSTAVVKKGCFYSSYNPCEDVNQVPALKWKCKFCDTNDGCNPANKVFINYRLMGILLVVGCILTKFASIVV